MKSPSERVHHVVHVAVIVLAVHFAVAIFLPVESGDFLWNEIAETQATGPERVLVIVVIGFPVLAAPVLGIAGFVRERALLFGILGVCTLFQLGPLVVGWTLLSLGGMGRVGAAEAAIGTGILAAVLGLTAAPAGATGLAVGSSRTIWRVMAGIGGIAVLLASTGFLIASLQAPGPWLFLFFVPVFAGSMSLIAALRSRNRALNAKLALEVFVLFWLLPVLMVLAAAIVAIMDSAPIRLLVVANFLMRIIGAAGITWLFLVSTIQFFSPVEAVGDA